MEGGAEHVTRRGYGAGDEAVDAAEAHHHAAEVYPLGAEGLLRGREVDELLLFGWLARLLGVPSLEVGRLELRVALRVVNRLDAALGKRKPGLRLGGGYLLSRAQHDRRANLAVHARARRRDDTRIHSLRQHNRAVQSRSLFDYFFYCVHCLNLFIVKL